MGERISILCISSDEEVSFIRALLKESPYRGSRTYHARSISTAPLTRHYDLIITDLSDGIESILSLKQLYPHIPVLYFGDNSRLAKRAISLGAQDYLPKDEIDATSFSRAIVFAKNREEITEQLKEKTFTDELTGLYNRRGFMTLMQQQMLVTTRSHQGFILFLFDIDWFKKINDRYGHLIGDDALIQTAWCLRKAFRSHDIVGRIGGDEFAVLALNSHPEGEAIFKRHLFSRLKELNATHRPYFISCSIGSAYYCNNGLTLQELLEQADNDLYLDKKRHHCLLLGREERM